MSASETITLRVNGETRQLDDRPEDAAALRAARRPRLEEPEVRLRDRALRRLQGAD